MNTRGYFQIIDITDNENVIIKSLDRLTEYKNVSATHLLKVSFGCK